MGKNIWTGPGVKRQREREWNAEVARAVSELQHVKDWADVHLQGAPPADEQIAAIGERAPSCLLKARAGSGKTRVIVDKARFLMEHEGVAPDKILILAFNKDAASEISRRIRHEHGLHEFDNARTFHSLAYKLVQPKGELLYDGNVGGIGRQSESIQKLIRHVINPVRRAQIYLFFRQEMKELEDIGAFMSEKDYYTYRRNHTQDSLRGDPVKSHGEKWIADFLFEHGVRYAYERIWFWDDGTEGNYHPDFTIWCEGRLPSVVVEHWGIDLNDPAKRTPPHWNQTWWEYRAEIDRKREYWVRWNERHPNKSIKFLETSIVDLRRGRDEFERTLLRRLSEAGVRLAPVPVEELHKRVETAQASRLTEMCLQYIQRAKKLRLTPVHMGERISQAQDIDARTRAFLRIANGIYKRYQAMLDTSENLDFDDLMASAIDLIHDGRGECRIRITNERFVSMNELQWVIVDEYQDFSPLFNGLVEAIRTYNPDCNLFCVGDDWQAINAFAGSDLHYFSEFSDHHPGASILSLRNNYRSAPKLVALASGFMADEDAPSIPVRRELEGSITLLRTDQVFIERRGGQEHREDREADERFVALVERAGRQRGKDQGHRVARVLKTCHQILTDPRYPRTTTFAILSRVKQLSNYYRDLNMFSDRLKGTLLPDEKRRFGDFEARVRCCTVHKAKGLEADVVILLSVDSRLFPKIHPDNELYSILGVTPQQVLKEEERLFYVAITRARRDLYILTETGRESEYIDRLGL